MAGTCGDDDHWNLQLDEGSYLDAGHHAVTKYGIHAGAELHICKLNLH